MKFKIKSSKLLTSSIYYIINCKGQVYMNVIRLIILGLIFISSSSIGILLAKRYGKRVEELKEMKNALNMLKTKIKFTQEPLPEMFEQISKTTNTLISNVFQKASNEMKKINATQAWNQSIDETSLNINNEDKNIIKNFGKLLGKTDIEGQLSEIELTNNFIDMQIEKAEEEKQKNEKIYKTLGTVIGLAIVIVLL